MSDTPRTDALHRSLTKLSETPQWIAGKDYCDMLDHARTLERELAAITKKRDRLRWQIENALLGLRVGMPEYSPDDVEYILKDALAESQ